MMRPPDGAPGPALTAAPAPPRRLWIWLYVVAGMPLGALGDVIPVYLRLEGLSLRDIGLFSALHLPYSLKVFLGPAIDRTGHVRRWLGATALGLACSYALLTQVRPHARPGAFAACCLLMTAASATFDVTLDACFVRGLAGATPAAEARANAWRLSAFKFAMVAVGSGALVLGGAAHFVQAFAVLLLLHGLLLASAPWSALPEAPPRQARTSFADYLAGLGRWLRRPPTLRAFALVFAYKLAIASLLCLERAWWVDRGIALTTLGAVGAGVGLGSTVAGAALGSTLAHRRGIGSMLAWGVWSQVGVAAVYGALLHLPARAETLAVGLGCSGACFGLSTAALMSFITRLCRAPHAATQFAALTGTYALTRAAAGAVSGTLAERYGFAALFATVAALALPALALLPRSIAARRALGIGGVDL